MKGFVSDLDNTLIYSYKKNIKGKKIVVEKKEEKEISFMSEYSHKKLEKINENYEFIPLTTRSLEQYRRISFFNNSCIKKALVSNGGILLENSKIVKEWYEKSMKLAKISLEELKKAKKILSNRKEIYFEIRFVDNLFLFTKSSNEKVTLDILRQELDLKLINISNHGEKIYVFPKDINKGKSLERLREYYKYKKIIVAGDSEMDIPMLEKGDISIFPAALKNKILKKNDNYIIKTEENLFSDKILEIVDKKILDMEEKC